MAAIRTLSLMIESRADCIELIGGAVRGVFDLAPLPAGDGTRLELAVTEAINNVVEHAYDNQPGHRILVECWLEPDRFSVLVCDEGKAMEPLILATARDFQTPDPADPDTWGNRGRGLAIIQACVDTVEYASDRDRGLNTLKMSKRLNQSVSGQTDANAGQAAVPSHRPKSQADRHPE
ncbi:MAG: ATP-binding protein [Candidatus Competibacter sp.]|nr:ATP-binding protein [Candidatus Competibacter sp.]